MDNQETKWAEEAEREVQAIQAKARQKSEEFSAMPPTSAVVPEPEETLETGDSVKLITIVFIVLGLIVPFWLITLPLFWYFAYLSYKGPKGTPVKVNIPARQQPQPTSVIVQTTPVPSQSESTSKQGKYDALEQLASMKERGLLSEEEFAQEKKKILENSHA